MGQQFQDKIAARENVTAINFLYRKGNYSATSNNEVATLAFDEWAVTHGTERRALRGAAARPDPSSIYQIWQSTH